MKNTKDKTGQNGTFVPRPIAEKGNLAGQNGTHFYRSVPLSRNLSRIGWRFLEAVEIDTETSDEPSPGRQRGGSGRVHVVAKNAAKSFPLRGSFPDVSRAGSSHPVFSLVKTCLPGG